MLHNICTLNDFYGPMIWWDLVRDSLHKDGSVCDFLKKNQKETDPIHEIIVSIWLYDFYGPII